VHPLRIDIPIPPLDIGPADRSPSQAPPRGPSPPLQHEPVLLTPQGAVYWPAADLLLAADLHLGKAETFQSRGIPIPAAVSDRSLDLLSQAISLTRATRVLILGDLVHARPGLTESLIDRLSAWRRAHPDLELSLVPGNHDRGIDHIAGALGLRVLGAAYTEGPFAFIHDPAPHPGRYTWAGHLHPVVRLPGGRDAPRLPAFHLGPRVGILPAMGPFTAGLATREPGARLFALAPQGLVEV
jgi:uncharacterized protein